MGLLMSEKNVAKSDFCPNFNGIAVSKNNNQMLVARLRCKMWNCAYCAIRNAAMWKAAIIDGINKSGFDLWCFLTLTLPPHIHNTKDAEKRVLKSYKWIREQWDKLAKRLKRWLGQFQYVRVVEKHKSGVLHIHMLLSCHIPDVKITTRKNGSQYGRSKTLAKHLKETGWGYIHDAKNLVEKNGENWHGGAVAAYVAKYITKDDSASDAARREYAVRKIQTSRAFKAPHSSPDNEWKLKSGVYLDDIYADRTVTWHDISTGKDITTDDFLDSYIYPDIGREREPGV